MELDTLWVISWNVMSGVPGRRPTYAADTKGFHMENLRIDTSNATCAAVGFRAYRTQEIDGSGNETLYGYKRFFAGGAEQWRFNCASSSSCNIDSWTSGSPVHHVRLYKRERNRNRQRGNRSGLPCQAYNQPNVSESAQSGSYATVFTTSAAGVYRVNGYTYSNVCGTSTAGNMTVTLYVKAAESGSAGASGATVSSWQVGSSTTSCSSGVNYSG